MSPPLTPQTTLSHPLALTTPIPLTEHPAAVYLSLLAKGSRPTMKQSLDAIASLLTDSECDAMTLDWAQLRYQHAAAIQAVLLEQHAPSTARKMMCALRRVLKEAKRLDLISDRDYSRTVDLPQIKKNQPKLAGRALSRKEISKLLVVCRNDPTVLGARDEALIAILRWTGVRRDEAVNLDLQDMNIKVNRKGKRKASIEVRGGKGNKDRTVFLSSKATAYLDRWLEVRGPQPGPLLYPLHKGGRIRRKRMTAQALSGIVKTRGEQAGLKPFSPHDFRRTFCTHLFEKKVDIATIQELAGHSSPTETAKYNRAKDKTKQKAVETLD